MPSLSHFELFYNLFDNPIEIYFDQAKVNYFYLSIFVPVDTKFSLIYSFSNSLMPNNEEFGYETSK